MSAGETQGVASIHRVPATVFVVGGSAGIGGATVARLCELGAKCAVGYSSNEEVAQRLVERVEAAGGHPPVLVRGDVANDAERMVAHAAEQLGGLEAVVCTPSTRAGTGRILSAEKDDFHQSLDVMVWGFVDVVRHALPWLEPVGGSAIAVSSLGATQYAKYYGMLGPGKAALETAIRYLAAEVGPRQVRVNGVSPSLIDDALHNAEGSATHDLMAPIARRTPLRRLARPDEIGDVIVTLLTPAFRYMTGQTIKVDGGYSLLA